MPYPPGMSRHDLRRAGIIETSIPCPECSEEIKNGEIDEHEDWCTLKDRDYPELAEMAEEAKRPSYDEWREEQL